jgi:RNA polymerase sigma factor (TIGR02999 family)
MESVSTGAESFSIEELLRAAREGGRGAVDRLLPVVYDELRRMAGDYLRGERQDHTLDATALVHEAYLKLVNQRTGGWGDRKQFFAVASKVMRRILVDHARRRRAAKRGGGRRKTALDDAVASFDERSVDLVAFDEALAKLGAVDDRKSRVVELRFFGGLSVDETAQVLDVPLRTVERDWTMAKAWLRTELGRD